ncbi:hypothetical protein [Flavobacterium aquiphilum]|uniref:hypothetical protein n=1 Tax=Flavobacterium aquiphilum TaxID=3003261 RepID=UPI002480D722|nr:hypothetical protein [Flavobacterium aquiphilum]
MIKIFFATLICLLFVNCDSNERSTCIYLYSKDKSQVISILSDYGNNERIIAVGKVVTQPVKNYVKLDISEVVELGDEIGVCWLGKKKGWQLVNDKSKIINVRLDTTKYIIKTSWYQDEKGIPNTTYYENENCYTVGTLNYSKVHPYGNGYIERN